MSRPTITLTQLRAANVSRCETFHAIGEWSETDYACALAGEVGELCNLIKKRRRGDDIPPAMLADEIADVLIYLDLLAARLGIQVDGAVVRKFNAWSVSKGLPQRLELR